MIHPDTELRFIDGDVGYGVFATQPIPRGTIVWTLCRFDRVLTRDEVSALPPAYQNVLARYAYVDREARYVLCWDFGRYVNHSCEPSMLGLGPDLEIVVRDVKPGDHLTCEYAALNLTSRMACHCGAPTCRRVVGRDDVLREWPEWDALVAATLPLVSQVSQPLAPFVSDPHRLADWIHGRLPAPSHREYLALDDAATGVIDQRRPWSLRARAGAL